MSLEFLVHGVSGREVRYLSGVWIKYYEEGKGIYSTDTTLLWIEESTGTMRNSPNDVHLMLQFHLQRKSLPIKTARIIPQRRKKYFQSGTQGSQLGSIGKIYRLFEIPTTYLVWLLRGRLSKGGRVYCRKSRHLYLPGVSELDPLY